MHAHLSHRSGRCLCVAYLMLLMCWWLTGTKRSDLVVYNRVPKTGSSSWQQHIDSLGKRLGFTTSHHSVPPHIPCPSHSYCVNTSHTFRAEDVSRMMAAVAAMPNVSGGDVIIDYHWFAVEYPGAWGERGLGQDEV